MPTSLVESDTILAIDIGAATTRAILFDVVDGRYRFVAAGQSTSTATAPLRDVSEGVRRAIENLQDVTGRILLDTEHHLIVPSQSDGSGIDVFSATISAGPPIKTVVTGLLSDVSLESMLRLARTTYSRVVEVLGMNDKRKPEQQLDSILRHQPDLILIAGGAEGGASRSVEKILEIIGLACFLVPASKRPIILYAGNSELAEEVQEALKAHSFSLHMSPNVRPSLDVEDLDPAQRILAGLIGEVRRRQMAGIEELNTWSGGTLIPTAYGQGRMIRFLSQVYDSGKGLLGLDAGLSAVSLASAFNGKLSMGVYPHLGLGESLAGLLRHTSLDDITRWLPIDVPVDVVRDYIFQKAIYPTTIPAAVESLAVEQALTRQVLHLAVQAMKPTISAEVPVLKAGQLPVYEPILAAGSAITSAPTLGQSLLILLDALQPVGITTIVLDQNNLAAALGAAAVHNSLLPVQVLESGAFLTLAAVVSPISNARYSAPILNARLILDDGHEAKAEVRQGSLEVLPLPVGQSAKLQLSPIGRTDVGLGPGRGGSVRVTGGALGVIIDARGRPLQLPTDPVRRRELMKKWLWTVGG